MRDETGKVELTEEQLALVREALDDFQKGKGHSTEEVRELIRRKVDGWMAPKNQSA